MTPQSQYPVYSWARLCDIHALLDLAHYSLQSEQIPLSFGSFSSSTQNFGFGHLLIT